MQKSTRAKLVRLYYELCLLPGIEPRIRRNWADMVSRLLANKPGIKPKLDATDLALPWKPLWRVLQKELWPKTTLDDLTYVSYHGNYIFVSTLSDVTSSTFCFILRTNANDTIRHKRSLLCSKLFFRYSPRRYGFCCNTLNFGLLCSIDSLEYDFCLDFFPASDPHTSLSAYFVQDMGGF